MDEIRSISAENLPELPFLIARQEKLVQGLQDLLMDKTEIWEPKNLLILSETLDSAIEGLVRLRTIV